MVKAIDSLPSQQLRSDRRSLRQAVKNIALRAYTIKSSNFPGFSCIVRDNRRSGFTDNSLACNKNPNFTENFKVLKKLDVQITEHFCNVSTLHRL